MRFDAGPRARLAATLVVAATVVFVAAGVLVGCGSEDGYAGNPTGTRVAILGDSITNNAYADVRAALDPTYQSRISDWIGWTFDWGRGEAEKFAPSRPDRVVVEYGTNDSGKGLSLETVAGYMDTVISSFPDACIVMVNVGDWFTDAQHDRTFALGLNALMAEGTDGVIERSLQREQAAGNAAVTESDVRDQLHLGPVIVADYAGTLGSDLATNFSTDPHRIHPSQVGNAAYADLLKRTLDTCPLEPEATTTSADPTSSSVGDVTSATDPTTTDPTTTDTSTPSTGDPTSSTIDDSTTTELPASSTTSVDVPTTTDPGPPP